MKSFEHDHDSLYIALNNAIRHYYLRTHELLEKIGLYPGQPRVLHALWKKDGLSQKQIGKELNIKPSTVTVMIKRMEKAGLVKRVQDTKDLRVTKVYLEQKGIDLKEEVKTIGKKVNEEIFHGFSEEEKKTIGEFLDRVSKNLENKGGTN